jgi:hypothetical protein
MIDWRGDVSVNRVFQENKLELVGKQDMKTLDIYPIYKG